jgi:hypothetical protein
MFDTCDFVCELSQKKEWGAQTVKKFANNLYRIDIVFSDFSHYSEVACLEKLRGATQGRRL